MAPTQEELERRRRIGINSETVTNVTSTDFPGHWPGEDHEWHLEKFKKNFQVKCHTNFPFDASFSLVGIDASIANAFRRILIAEIPTLAVENVYIYQNTSIIQDEVLAHRLGLIPLTGDPKGFSWMGWYKDPTQTYTDENQPVQYDWNSALMQLNVECKWQEGGIERAQKGETDPDKLYTGHNVYARDITWDAVGKQKEMFAPDKPIQPTNPDILIAKMRPGQHIHLSMHCVKGTGADHAKFSPVATASYRLLPTIDILSPITGDDARKFARCFPKGVVSVEPITQADTFNDPEYQGKEGDVKAVVADPMRDTVSRECLRHPEFKDKVKLGRVRDHFIFRVESTGQVESEQLFLDAVKMLKVKCARVQRGLDAMMK